MDLGIMVMVIDMVLIMVIDIMAKVKDPPPPNCIRVAMKKILQNI